MLNLTVCRLLVTSIKESESDRNVVSVIITGAGTISCAGAPLCGIKPDKDKLKTTYSVFLSVARCALPTITALNGPAIGAGFNMALACDARIILEDAILDPKFLRLGLHPGGVCSWLLRRLCCWNTAAGLLLFSKLLSAYKAVEQGLAGKSAKKEDLLEDAVRYTDTIRHLPKELVIHTKRTLLAADASSHFDDILEIKTQEQLWAL